MDDDEGGALGDAFVEGLGDGGFGEFHVCGFDDGGVGDFFEEVGGVDEHVVGGGFFGAVIDDDKAEGVVGEGAQEGAFQWELAWKYSRGKAWRVRGGRCAGGAAKRGVGRWHSPSGLVGIGAERRKTGV